MLPEQARNFLDKIITDAEPAGEKSPLPTLARPRLAPYMWDAGLARGVCRACWQGSGVLAKLILRSLWRGISAARGAAWRGKTRADRWESLGIAALAGTVGAVVVVIVGGAVVYVAAPYAGPIGIAAGVAWLIAAGIVAPATTAAPVERAEEPGEQPAQPPLDAAMVAELVRRIAAAGGWQGAHLDDLLANLPGRSRGELLAVLAGAKIPVADQLKLTLPGGRQRNRQGVRLSTLPEGLGEAVPAPASPPSHHPAELVPDPPPRVAPVTVHGGG